MGYPILVSEVEAGSVPEEAGLRVGDMVSIVQCTCLYHAYLIQNADIADSGDQ